MSKFTWRDDYRVGNDLIDGQHEHLFKLANKVFDAQDKHALKHCVHELFRYVRKHFKDEERLMSQLNYPDYDHHVQLHNEIESRLSKIDTEFKNDRFSITELQTLMHDWLLSHILKDDKFIGDFARKQH
jgi:hemerythrin